MIDIIAAYRSELVEICRQYRVRRLEVFGSSVDGRFDPDTSDLDFLVDYLPLELDEYADAYVGLHDALVDLYGRRVDLVMVSAIKNPYFVQGIAFTRTLVYAA